MKRTLLHALGLLVLAACHPALPESAKPVGPCGAVPPVDVIVDSNQFADVRIQDADGRRLGMAYGKRVTRFHFCAYAGQPARFILDPVGGQFGYVVDGGMDPTPGSTVLMTLGAELRISFAFVVPPQ